MEKKVVNPNIIIEAFNSFISGSDILAVLFYATSVLVVFFYTIQMTRLYGKSMLGGTIEVKEILRPLIVLVLIIAWKWIYFNILVAGFDALIAMSVDKINAVAGAKSAILYRSIQDAALEGEISFFSLTIEAGINWFLKWFVLGLNIIMDVFLAMYVGVNDLILGIMAPIVLGFMMLEETKDIFIRWLRYFFFFRIFMLFIIIGNHLGIRLMEEIATRSADIFGLALAGGEGVFAAQTLVAISALCLLGYLAFKILFIAGVYKILQSLLGVGEGGIGGGTKSLASGVASGVKMVATKGAVA